MASTYTGIFLRDLKGQTPGQSVSKWTESPDVFPYTRILHSQYAWLLTPGENGYEWIYRSNPIYTMSNFVYVRGLPYKTGKLVETVAPGQGQKARIYLFYCQPTDFHLPAKWVSVGVSAYDPIHNKTIPGQNYDEVQVQTYTSDYQGDTITGVGAIATFEWTPPALATNQTAYRLIAWVQNDDTDFVPTSLGTDLGSGAALQEWVESHSNMAVYDTAPTYGILVRDFIGQTSYQSGSNNLASPDIGVNGTSPLAPTAITGTYAQALPHLDAVPNTWNYVYVRGKSINAGQKSKIYLYYAPASKIAFPDNWKSDNIISGNSRQNWAEVTATNTGDMVTATFMWQPPALDPAESAYSLIVYVDNRDDDSTFDPGNVLAYLGSDDTKIGNSMAGYFNIACVKTVPVATGTTVPTVQGIASLTAAAAATNVLVGLKFTSMSADGKFTFTVNGPDSANTINYTANVVANGNQVVLMPASYLANFQAAIAYNFWSSGTQPEGASVVPVAYAVDSNSGTLTPIALSQVTIN